MAHGEANHGDTVIVDEAGSPTATAGEVDNKTVEVSSGVILAAIERQTAVLIEIRDLLLSALND